MEILQIEVFYLYGYIAWTLNESIVPIYVCNAPKKYSMWSILIYWYDLLKKSNGLKVEIGTTIQILQFEELPYVLSKYGKWLFAKWLIYMLYKWKLKLYKYTRVWFVYKHCETVLLV